MRQILETLSAGGYHPAQEIADQLGVGTKTVRNLLKEINEEISDHGALIQSKYGEGYYLEVQNPELYAPYKKKMSGSGTFIPSTSEERVQYLLEYLFNSPGYTKMDKLSEMLYISKRTLSEDLREVEKFLNKYHIELVRRPGYGIAVDGKEFNFRLCIASFSSKRFHKGNQSMEEIAGCVAEILTEQNFHLSSAGFQNLVVHLYIAISRIVEGHCIPMPEETDSELIGSHEYEVAQRVAEHLQEYFKITFPNNEVRYIAIHLAGKELFNAEGDSSENLVISQEISDLVTEMLESVYEAFRFDFRGDLELRMILSQHIVPLQVRIHYKMKARNPLLKDVKKKFCLSYAIASHASTVINEHYQTELCEDEVAYFAFAFALALERIKTEAQKKNILLVCASGRGSARLIEYKYKKMFGPYLNKVTACDVASLKRMDLREYDYIFTSVPIPVKVPIPIQEVKTFLDETEFFQIRKVLLNGEDPVMQQYYRRELFLPHLNVKTRKEAIRCICEFAMKKMNLGEEFYESVLERERMAKTAFGNLVAMPHCYKAMSEETFVCLAILDQPIQWADQKVQVVFLVSIANKDQCSMELQKFYQTTASFMLSQKCVQDLIHKRDYDWFLDTMTELEAELSS